MDRKYKLILLILLAVTFALAVFFSPYADTNPDGLDRVSEDLDFNKNAENSEVWQHAPMRDYSISALSDDSNWGTQIAGLLGVIAVLVLTFGFGYLLSKKKKQQL